MNPYGWLICAGGEPLSGVSNMKPIMKFGGGDEDKDANCETGPLPTRRPNHKVWIQHPQAIHRHLKPNISDLQFRSSSNTHECSEDIGDSVLDR